MYSRKTSFFNKAFVFSHLLVTRWIANWVPPFPIDSKLLFSLAHMDENEWYNKVWRTEMG
ncbi:hypothetical protein GCM10010916_48860 [Paenibacillus abyssi]|uniref:Uncharacterized protein n=1 Tax=Paenibacillus abyssi TaxID=1340531 RepID=A0A917G809_9BACL|nr:hypothetical protein GCM10010916_48860 [Paenibacillus abyssi]